jgi:hypothetical protein
MSAPLIFASVFALYGLLFVVASGGGRSDPCCYCPHQRRHHDRHDDRLCLEDGCKCRGFFPDFERMHR